MLLVEIFMNSSFSSVTCLWLELDSGHSAFPWYGLVWSGHYTFKNNVFIYFGLRSLKLCWLSPALTPQSSLLLIFTLVVVANFSSRILLIEKQFTWLMSCCSAGSACLVNLLAFALFNPPPFHPCFVRTSPNWKKRDQSGLAWAESEQHMQLPPFAELIAWS